MGVTFMLLNKPEKARPFITKVLKIPSFSKKVSIYFIFYFRIKILCYVLLKYDSHHHYEF